MLWIKSLHIISMVTWFAGLFYLPRLFVYHAEAHDAISLERFKIMERKLYYGIMMPGLFFTIFFGLWLIHYNMSGYMKMSWMHAKLTLVALLMLYHFYLMRLQNAFKANRNTHSATFYRILNEVPILFLVAIVILVVVKP
ncbi:MAG: TIGR00701 family protein [Gammaproteobacteria bacterium RIFCSPHIGHO2_12_FULL_42_10]|nr:MAG: TIGR00701 family protein [Gammaproteobacteria bacterium RIFCSPHIGHO2_12_FULL_42_10]